MSGEGVVLDTNIILYFLDDINVNKFFDDYNPVVSFITELELLSAPEISQKEKLVIQNLLNDLTVVKYSDNFKDDIVKVRSQKKLKLPDAIISALAITLDMPLVTADKALKNIDGLDLIFYKIRDNE